MTDNTKKLANAPTYDNEVYVGPDWIRPGRHIDQPMLDKRLTEEEIVNRAEKKRIEWELAVSRLWAAMVPAVILLVIAAWLFSTIRGPLR